MARTDAVALDASTRRHALAAAGVCLLPLLLQLPGHVALGIAAAALAIAWISRRRPVPALPRLLLAFAVIGATFSAMGFGFGRDTGCALLAAMLAIKPAETWRMRDARSLVGFALFAPFATFLLDQGPLSLLLGLASVTAALTTLQMLADVESGAPRPEPLWRRSVSVWKLALLGLPLALAAFWLFPRFASPLWGVPERAIGLPGLSDSMTPGGWLDLMNDESVALRVEFHGREPMPEQMYWRGPVLWDFDGRTWTQPRWYRAIEPADVASAPVAWDYTYQMEATDRFQLVALDLPKSAPAGTRLSVDYGLFAERPLSAPTQWRVRSSPPAVFQPDLPQMFRRAALSLPDGFNPRTQAFAAQWRAEVDADPRIAPQNKDAVIADRALRMIRAEFAYTLSTPLPGRHAVDEFLFDQKEGFCEHFSSAFVVLMRSAGIPARVVTGYAGGYRNPLGGYWVVRQQDAHAWAEVWLPGRGWVRYDPTAAVAPERIYDTIEDLAPAFGGLGAMRPVWNASDWVRRGWNDFVVGFDAARQRELFRPLGFDDVDGTRLALLFSLAAALGLAWMLWLAAREARARDPLLRAWHRLGARYRRHGLQREPAEPALDWARRVVAARPQDKNLKPLAARFSEWRYAGGSRAPGEIRELLRALRSFRPSP